MARWFIMQNMINKQNLNLRYFSQNILIVLGLVLMWRGVWYVLDGLDYWLFGGSHTFTSLIGILIGLAILYLPDGDLKEISKL
jgi:hypothetical protein